MAKRRRLADRLWEANVGLWEACLLHPFVRGLSTGTLGMEAFKRYVAQDAFFLRAFGRAYAMAAARAESIETYAAFHELMGGVLDEIKLHRSFAESLGIDLDAVHPFRATRAYTDFLLRAAALGTPGDITAAMTPCLRLYAFLGTSLAKESGTEGKYGDWIKTYSSKEFQRVVRILEDLLNRVADDTPSVQDGYRYALACELEFFNAPLDPTSEAYG